MSMAGDMLGLKSVDLCLIKELMICSMFRIKNARARRFEFPFFWFADGDRRSFSSSLTQGRCLLSTLPCMDVSDGYRRYHLE